MGSASFLAKKALQGVNAIRGIINSEKKYFDTTVAFSNVLSSGQLECLTLIPAGDDVNQRNGNSILAKTLYVQGQILSAPGAQTFFRIIYLMDTLNQGIDPTVADILSNAGTLTAPTCPLNVDKTSRYKILRDKRYSFDDSKGLTHIFKDFLPINTHLKFTSTSSSGIYKNALYVIMVSDHSVTTYAPEVRLVSRLGYYDN